MINFKLGDIFILNRIDFPSDLDSDMAFKYFI